MCQCSVGACVNVVWVQGVGVVCLHLSTSCYTCDVNLQVDLQYLSNVRERHQQHRNLTQHVKSKIHKRAHTLDSLITTEEDANKVTNISCTPQVFSDHYSLEFDLLVGRPRISKTKISCRNTKNIEVVKLTEDIKKTVLLLSNKH